MLDGFHSRAYYVVLITIPVIASGAALAMENAQSFYAWFYAPFLH